jgi:DNA polymerase III epsilon subunit-like protein
MKMPPKKLAKYIVIDTETSGLRSFENGLIQLASIALDSQLEIVDTFDKIVNPPTEAIISDEALAISGITQEKIKNGISYREVCEKYTEFIQINFLEKPVIIAQFFPFDYGFLDRVFSIAFDQSKIQLDITQFPFQDLLSRNFIDTKSLASAINLKQEVEGKSPIFQSTSLSSPGGLADTLGIPADSFTAHDALGDCQATHKALIKLLRYI